jgi:hypothetical protein
VAVVVVMLTLAMAMMTSSMMDNGFDDDNFSYKI